MGIKAFAIAEQKDGKLSNVSFELITAAKLIGAELTTVILAESADPLAQELAGKGAGKVLAVSNPGLKYFNDEVYAKVMVELINKQQPNMKHQQKDHRHQSVVFCIQLSLYFNNFKEFDR